MNQRHNSTDYRSCRNPRFGLSHISWQTSVAHHPPEDKPSNRTRRQPGGPGQFLVLARDRDIVRRMASDAGIWRDAHPGVPAADAGSLFGRLARPFREPLAPKRMKEQPHE